MAALTYEAQDAQLRAETVCRGCGKPKDPDLVFCWGCFKYGDIPFKYHDGSALDWLREIGGDISGLDGGSAETDDDRVSDRLLSFGGRSFHFLP